MPPRTPPHAPPHVPHPRHHPDHPHLVLTEVRIITGRGKAPAETTRYTVRPGPTPEQLTEIRLRITDLIIRLQRTAPRRHRATPAIPPTRHTPMSNEADDILQALADADQAATDLETRIKAGDDTDAATIAAITAQRDALQALVDAGGGATAEQLLAIKNGVAALADHLKRTLAA